MSWYKEDVYNLIKSNALDKSSKMLGMHTVWLIQLIQHLTGVFVFEFMLTTLSGCQQKTATIHCLVRYSCGAAILGVMNNSVGALASYLN